MKLSEKGLNRSLNGILWANYEREMLLLPRLANSQNLNLRPIRTFQTVSLGSWMNEGEK
jgi:hypothetical protein